MNEEIFAQIRDEIQRQKEIWGELEHLPPSWVSIITEEIGEVAKACNQHDAAQMQQELIQVAATAIAAIKSLEKYAGDSKS